MYALADEKVEVMKMTRTRLLLLLLTAPLIGAAFVVFLPALGFYLVGKELMLKVVKALPGEVVFHA